MERFAIVGAGGRLLHANAATDSPRRRGQGPALQLVARRRQAQAPG